MTDTKASPPPRASAPARAPSQAATPAPAPAPAPASHDKAKTVRLRVVTARGIPSRSRAGIRFTSVPEAIVVTEDQAKEILADTGLVAFKVGDSDNFGEGTEAQELQSLRAEVAALRNENAQLKTEKASLEAEMENRARGR